MTRPLRWAVLNALLCLAWVAQAQVPPMPPVDPALAAGAVGAAADPTTAFLLWALQAGGLPAVVGVLAWTIAKGGFVVRLSDRDRELLERLLRSFEEEPPRRRRRAAEEDV